MYLNSRRSRCDRPSQDRLPRLLLGAAIVVFLSSTAEAATFTVTNTNDGGAGSLREAINLANNNATADTIVFAAGVSGLIPSSSELLIRNNLTIIGPGSANLEVRRSGGSFYRIFNLLDFASGSTGGIFVNISGLTISNGSVDSSSFPSNSGGGIFNEQYCTLTLSDCRIRDNAAVNRGIGAGWAGGIYNGGTLTLTNCTVSGNSASGGFSTDAFGGGIANLGTLTIRESTVSGNSSIRGSGILNSGTLTMSNSAILSNQSPGNGDGGGILHSNGTALIENCTFASNFNYRGGAIATGQAITLKSCTFFNNRAASNGGDSIYVTASTCQIGNSVFYKDVVLDHPIVLVGGTITSLGYNLSDDGGSGFLNAATDQLNTDPKLDSFGPQDNGGPTFTVALLDGSPALDKGNGFNSGNDQRLRPRPVDDPAIPNASGGNGSDIGAYEATEPLQGGASVLVNTTADHDDGVCGPSDCTLREAIRRANTVFQVNAINFAPYVLGTITLTLGELPIADSITIQGPGARLLRVSGNTLSRIFSLSTSGLGGTLNVTIAGLTISDGWIAGQVGASVEGGGVYNSATLTLRDCTLNDNRASGGSGGPQGQAGGTGRGGAIFNAGSLTLERCTLRNNGATGGFGADNPPPDDFTLTTGGAGGSALGGAVFNDSNRDLTIYNCTFAANNAGAASGGSGHNGGNGGSGLGGAIYNLGTLNVYGSTFSGNTGFGAAGGGSRPGGTNGSPGLGAGGLAAAGGTSTLRNTISAGNSASGTFRYDISGAFISGGYNLIGRTEGGSGFTATGDQTGSNAAPLNAQLASLADNGGPTDTMRLLSNSPAIDKGHKFVLTTDQRLRGRPSDNPAIPNANGGDGSDIGAYEVGGLLVVTTLDDHSDGTCNASDCTLREAILVADEQTAEESVITFASGLSGIIQLVFIAPPACH